MFTCPNLVRTGDHLNMTYEAGETSGTWKIVEVTDYGYRRCVCVHCGEARLISRQGVQQEWKWHRGCVVPDPGLASRKARLAKTWETHASDHACWPRLAAEYEADPAGCARRWRRHVLLSVQAWIENRNADARAMRAARERTGFRGAWLNGGAP